MYTTHHAHKKFRVSAAHPSLSLVARLALDFRSPFYDFGLRENYFVVFIV
jgi:hypothetical protein